MADVTISEVPTLVHGLISRAEAKERGLARYFTGKPCKHGHVAEHYAANGSCSECCRRQLALRYARDPAKWRRTSRDYGRTHREERIAYNRQWYANHPEKAKAATAAWVAANPRRWAKYNREYYKQRRASDVQYRLAASLRITMHRVLNRGRPRGGSAVRDLGCTIAELVTYIEDKFRNGMTWDNWGTVWELDHVTALSLFDLADRDHFLQAAHYTNLQPLTISEHFVKTKQDQALARARVVRS